jgi:hypothetical protein
MTKQMTLAGGGFEKYGKTTRRAAFLAEMERVVPWGQLCALIEPHYPKAGTCTAWCTTSRSSPTAGGGSEENGRDKERPAGVQHDHNIGT